jgi:hypothetical protein
MDPRRVAHAPRPRRSDRAAAALFGFGSARPCIKRHSPAAGAGSEIARTAAAPLFSEPTLGLDPAEPQPALTHVKRLNEPNR